TEHENRWSRGHVRESGIAARNRNGILAARSGLPSPGGESNRMRSTRGGGAVGKSASCVLPNYSLRAPQIPGPCAGPPPWTWRIALTLALITNSLQAGSLLDEFLGILGQ